MLKSSKAVLLVILTLGMFSLHAQNKPYYKDVLLNGKPAKLNTATGEFLVLNGKKVDTIKSGMVNSKTESPKTDSIVHTTKPRLKTKSTPVPYAEKTTNKIHIVKAGETLYAIANRYNISLEALKSRNSLKSNIIKIGQELQVGNDVSSMDTSQHIKFHTVTKGDTLYSIAKKYGTTVSTLMKLNGLKDNTIQIGQNLLLK